MRGLWSCTWLPRFSSHPLRLCASYVPRHVLCGWGKRPHNRIHTLLLQRLPPMSGWSHAAPCLPARVHAATAPLEVLTHCLLLAHAVRLTGRALSHALLALLLPIPILIPADSPLFYHISIASYVGLWGGTVLGLWSLGIYFANVWVHFVYPEVKKQQ